MINRHPQHGRFQLPLAAFSAALSLLVWTAPQSRGVDASSAYVVITSAQISRQANMIQARAQTCMSPHGLENAKASTLARPPIADSNGLSLDQLDCPRDLAGARKFWGTPSGRPNFHPPEMFSRWTYSGGEGNGWFELKMSDTANRAVAMRAARKACSMIMGCAASNGALRIAATPDLDWRPMLTQESPVDRSRLVLASGSCDQTPSECARALAMTTQDTAD